MNRMFSRTPGILIRPLIAALNPYAPGEQPKIKGLIKLNTNENPYPPSPKVLAAVKAAGIALTIEPQEFPPCNMFGINSPDGHPIIFHKRKA